MEISPLYHSTRPEGELLPQEDAAFGILESLGIDYDRVSSDPADTMEKCAAVSEVLGVPICKNLFLCNRQKTDFYLLCMGQALSYQGPEPSDWLCAAVLCPRGSPVGAAPLHPRLRLRSGADERHRTPRPAADRAGGL